MPPKRPRPNSIPAESRLLSGNSARSAEEEQKAANASYASARAAAAAAPAGNYHAGASSAAAANSSSAAAAAAGPRAGDKRSREEMEKADALAAMYQINNRDISEEADDDDFYMQALLLGGEDPRKQNQIFKPTKDKRDGKKWKKDAEEQAAAKAKAEAALKKEAEEKDPFEKQFAQDQKKLAIENLRYIEKLSTDELHTRLKALVDQYYAASNIAHDWNPNADVIDLTADIEEEKWEGEEEMIDDEKNDDDDNDSDDSDDDYKEQTPSRRRKPASAAAAAAAAVVPVSNNTFTADQVEACIRASKTPLRVHQARCVRHLFRRDTLLAKHPTGSGKTLLAAAVVVCLLKANLGMHAYIVTPKSLRKNFRDTLINKYQASAAIVERCKFLTHDQFYRRHKTPEQRQELTGHLLIVDEFHNFRNVSGKRSHVILHCGAFFRKILLLTATPAYNRASDMCIALALLHRTTHLIPTALFDQTVYAALEEKDARLIALIKQLFRCRISIYALEGNTLSKFPRVVKEVVALPMDATFYHQYKAMVNTKQREDLKDFEGGRKFKKSNITVFFSGLRRLVNIYEDANPNLQSPKIKWILNKLKGDRAKARVAEAGSARQQGARASAAAAAAAAARPAAEEEEEEEEITDPYQQTLIFSSFVGMGNMQMVDLLRNEGFTVGYIHGEVSEAERSEIVQKYNRREIQVLLISRAGGEGLDLVGTEVIIKMEAGWNQAGSDQVDGRGSRYLSHKRMPVHRRKVHVYDLVLDLPGEHERIQDYLQPDYVFESVNVSDFSVDRYMFRLSQQKAQTINRFYTLLNGISIEDANC
jgi:superfamily II DNA or RNA helicase